MARAKVKNSNHSYDRVKERTNLSKRETIKLMKEASRSGVSAGCMKPGPLREYLEKKGDAKRVKYYKGYIFIFAKTSTSCITMYPVDESVLLAQDIFEKMH